MLQRFLIVRARRNLRRTCGETVVDGSSPAFTLAGFGFSQEFAEYRAIRPR